jgi:hypothetical protein
MNSPSAVDVPLQTHRPPYQRFTTTVVDLATGGEMAFLVYPSPPKVVIRDVGADREFANPPIDAFLSGLDWIEPPTSLKRTVDLGETLALSALEEGFALGEAYVRFLVSEAQIPWTESPLTGQTVASLWNKGTGAGAGSGALAGLLAVGHGPLLLLSVPGGMVIGGAAFGISTALEQGLHERVLRLISPEEHD